MRSLLPQIADRVLGTRWTGVAGVVAALICLACLPALRFDFSPQTLFDATSEKARIYEAWRAEYGADDHALVVLLPCPMAELRCWDALAATEAALNGVARVSDVQSLLTLELPTSPEPGTVAIGPLAPRPTTEREAAALAARAAGHPLLRRTLIGADAGVAAVGMRLDDDVEAMAHVRPVIDGLREVLVDVDAAHGVTTHLLGPPAYRATVVSTLVSEELRFIPATSLVLILMLGWLFRSTTAVLIPLLSVGLGALGTVALMAATGQPVNIINTITTTLILVIGAADAVHVMTRYAAEREAGLDRPGATREALLRVGAACLLTSVTTAVGFATLQTARLPILRDFGRYAAAGVMLTFLVTLILVPWGLAWAKRDPLARAPRQPRLDRALDAVAELTIRRPRTVVAAVLFVFAVAAAGIPRATVDNFIMEYIPRDDPTHAAHAVLEDELAGVVFLDVVLDADGAEPWLDPALLARAAAAEAALLLEPDIQAASSTLGLLRELRWVQRGGAGDRTVLPSSRPEIASLLMLAGDAAESHLSFDRSRLRLTLRAGDVGARAYLQLEQRILAVLTEAFAGTSVRFFVTGTSQVGYSGIDSLIRDLFRSLGLAFVLIFGTLLVLFRAPKLVAIAMVPNLLPVAGLLGALGWAGRHLETLSAMTFSIGLGIAVDDTIHFIARYAEERRAGFDVEDAVRRSMRGTGRAIVHTSALLLAGFGVLYSSRFPPNQSFALLASALIFGALVADLLLLPALLIWLRPAVAGHPKPPSGYPAAEAAPRA